MSDEYRLLHPTETVIKPACISTKAGYIWASAVDGFRKSRFVGM